MPTRRPLAKLRDVILHSLTTIPFLRQQLTEMNVKPQPTYRRGLLLPDHLTCIPAYTGQLLPQPFVQTATGEALCLDEILGQRFALLKLYEGSAQPFAVIHNKIWFHLDTQFIAILADQNIGNTPHKGITTIIDSENRLHRLLRNRQDVFLLLRPDHYIMGIFDTSSLHRVEYLLARSFA